ncbi:MAG: hypothetical protein LLG06_07360 [Desulfobacteraceae bacterium]|nr:hypothetical protein [Desulfobacteraceae bacterium]
MAWTDADEDTVKAAILARERGEQIKRITAQDGRSVEYAEGASLRDLMSLLSEIRSARNAASGRRRFVLTSTSKGL